MVSFSRTKLGWGCAAGSACLIGAPTAVYLNKQSLVLDSTTRGGALTQSELDSTVQVGSPSGDLTLELQKVKAQEDKLTLSGEKESKFSERFDNFWKTLDSGYRNQQKGNDQTGNTFNFREELGSILKNERDNDTDWVISKAEYKDCSRITGGKTDYCGYLEWNKGASKYRLKVDRYGNGQSKSWDVTLLRLKSQSQKTEWYSRKSKKWDSALNKGLDSFQGNDKMAQNWWGKLDGVSIEINKK
ncbi:hypothetical protein [Candidatus Mycoplasma haematominutum]|uniref:Lipoprotein n=1 Tax=Candidatus Mycoplasma haematominutum 'Birmingham 1' TaxID=1116213 RepID=G8C2S7_9MOLU|nr:hypothetical protein [Candidatus Mycoplasma haematominutum]CCE66625.1 hypothetical protein MHM_01070 [Candidatus Mycoplasma haematominutum 'Birmingham 1']